MPSPTLENDSDDDGGDNPVVDGFDGEEDAASTTETEFDIGEVDLGIEQDEDIVAGFDGIEDEQGGAESDAEGTTSSAEDISIESAIEDGLSECAAIGLRGDERDRVQTEMKAVASKFKIGYFGERCVQKYLKTDLQDIPPEYGLAATLLVFAAVALYKRPDGEEKFQRAVQTIRERMSSDEAAPRAGADARREPAPAPEREREPEPAPAPEPAAPEPEPAPAADVEMENATHE